MTVSLPVGIDITKDLAILFPLCGMEMICQLLLGLATFRFFLDFKRSFMIPKQLAPKTKPRYLEFIKIQFHREVTLYRRIWLELENKSSMQIPHSNLKDNLLHWFNYILHRTFSWKIPAVARQGSTADFMIHADMLSPIKTLSQCYPSDAICIHRYIYIYERKVTVACIQMFNSYQFWTNRSTDSVLVLSRGDTVASLRGKVVNKIIACSCNSGR